MFAAWAKENKVKGWEQLYRAFDPKEQAKRRQWALKAYHNSKTEKEPRSKFNKSVTFKKRGR